MRLPGLLRRKQLPLPPARLRFMGEDDSEFVAIGDGLLAGLERQAGLGSHSAVLDLGCGYGRLAHALIRSGFEGTYLGLDVLERQIRWCTQNLGREGIEFRTLDIHNERYNPGGGAGTEALELDAAAFDVVALFSVFTHMWPEEIEDYLGKIAMALRPDGRVAATFFLLDDEWRRISASGGADFSLPYARSESCRYSSEEEPLHRVGYEVDWVRAAAARAGLAVERISFGTWSGRSSDASPADRAAYQDWVVMRV